MLMGINHVLVLLTPKLLHCSLVKVIFAVTR